MPKPIYVFYCIESFTEAWYQLSKEEQADLMSKVMAGEDGTIFKTVIYCDSRWSNEATVGWGVEEYPDIETYQKRVSDQEKLGFYRYISSKTILGTRMEE